MCYIFDKRGVTEPFKFNWIILADLESQVLNFIIVTCTLILILKSIENLVLFLNKGLNSVLEHLVQLTVHTSCICYPSNIMRNKAKY